LKPFPEPHDLIAFFEVEPRVLDPGVPWAYNHLEFEVTRGADRINCVIEPGYGVLRVRWSRSADELAFLDFNTVRGLNLEESPTGQVLTATFDESSELTSVRIRLRPQVQVFCHTEPRP